ncbi:MAG: kelch repeat-containing protein [Myxococcales bacterium]
MPGRHARLLILLFALSSACAPDLVPPDGTKLTCVDRADCPGTWVCAPAISRCVAPEHANEEPPALMAPAQVTPEAATYDGTLSLTFTVTKDLDHDPVVVADPAGMPQALVLDATRTERAARSYTFTYTCDGSGRSGAREVSIELVDVYGNVATVAGTPLVCDYVPPRATLKLSQEFAGLGAHVTLPLDFSEPLADLAVTMGGTIAWKVDAAATPPLAWLDVTDALPEGTYEVSVAAHDVAGNRAQLSAGTLVLDYGLEGSLLTVEPNPVRPGERLTVKVSAREPLVLGPDAAAVLHPASGAELSLGAPQLGVDEVVFLYDVPGTASGPYQARVAGVTDRAGNGPVSPWTVDVTVDGKPPGFELFEVADDSLNLGEVLTVTITADEDLGSAPTVSIKDQEIPHDSGTGRGPHLYKLEMTDPALTGTWQLFVTMVDVAGNAAFLLPRTVTVDTQAPGLLDLALTPTARDPADAVLVITTDELLGDVDPGSGYRPDATLVWDVDPGFVFDHRSGLNYVWRLPASSAAGDRAFTLQQVVLRDGAGNQAILRPAQAPTLLPATLTLDTTPPQIAMRSPGVVAPERYPALPAPGTWYANLNSRSTHAQVHVRFDVTDARLAGGRTEVLVGAAPASCTATSASADTTGYDCVYTLTGNESSGAQIVSITATDGAGNVTQLTSSDAGGPELVVYDFEPPTVSLASLKLTPGEIAPGVANPLPPWALRDITTGTGVSIFWAPSEAVRPGSEGAVLTPASLVVDEHLLDPSGRGPNELALRLAPSPAQGAVDLSITMLDLAGNPADFPAGGPLGVKVEVGLNVDTVAPAAPDLDAVTGLRYVRRPYGIDDASSAWDGKPHFFVEVDLATVPGNEWQLAFAGEDDGQGATDLAQAVQIGGRQGGPATIELSGGDRAVVYVAAADHAGNLSDASPASGLQAGAVRNVRWTGSLWHKVPGQSYDNPNVLGLIDAQERGSSLFARRDGLEVSTAAEVDAVTAADDGATLRSRGGGAWKSLGPSIAPAARAYAASAYDEARGAILMFGGGAFPAATMEDTWELRDGLWSQHCVRPDCPRPSPRQNAAAAYDAGRDVVVLFGGELTPGNPVGETWEWDGDAWRRACADPGCSEPPPRASAAMAYDRVRGKVLLFGGSTATGESDQLWEYDGKAWRLRCGSGTGCTGPVGLRAPSFVFDGARGVAVLFGGFGGASTRDQTWEWNGSSWAQRCAAAPCSTAGNHPPQREGAQMAFDPDRGRTVLYGGYDALGSLSDTWEWDGASWTQKCTGTCSAAGSWPGVRVQGVAAYDRSRGRVVLSGGGTGMLTYGSDTWEWDGTRWQQQCASGGIGCSFPSARSGHRLAYDAGRGRIVLFGGETSAFLDQTWEWDGSRWQQGCTASPCSLPAGHPTGRARHGLAYAGGSQVLAFGGSSATGPMEDTWTWDGAAWTQRCTSAPCSAVGGHPGPRQRVGLSFMGGTRALLFGGLTSAGENGETWEWTGSTWTQRCTAAPCSAAGGHPTARSDFSMAYDAARGRVVLFGGTAGGARSDETWEWNVGASTWSRVCAASPCADPANHPSARSQAALFYDEVRKRVVLFGGEVGINQMSDETWEWDGTAWHARCVGGLGVHCSPPMPRASSVAYFGARQEAVLWGGATSLTSTLADQWAWQSAAGDHPMHVARFDLGSARIPSVDHCQTDPELCPLRAVAATWVAGGLSSYAGPDVGASLLAYERGVWGLQQGNLAPDTSPEAMAWSSTAPLQLSRLVGGRGPGISLAAATYYNNGALPDYATLVTDHLEVSVDYRWAPTVSAALLADSFSAATLSSAVWASSSGASTTTAYAWSDTRSLVLEGGATLTSVPFDASGCNELAVSYYGKRGPDAPEGNDSLVLQLGVGSGAAASDVWIGGATDPSFTRRMLRITAPGALANGVTLRLSAIGTPGQDHFYVDDLRVSCMR